jgi:hypothetical protein
LPANADLAIGISFPSQGGGDNDVVAFDSTHPGTIIYQHPIASGDNDAPEIDESLLTLPKLHLQETPCFGPENRIWSSDPTIRFGTTYTEVRTHTYYPHQGPTSTIFVLTNSFPLDSAKLNRVVSSYFAGLTVPEQLPAPSLSRSLSAKETPNSSTASDSSISRSVSATGPQSATGILNLSLHQNTLKLDWPADHIGWILQTRTNPGINSEWFPVPGSAATNHLDLTLDRANTSVFFRLVAQ